MQGRTLRLGIAIVGTVILTTVEAMTVRAGIPATDILLNLAIGLTYLYGGLAVWARDPANRTGRLMTAVGLTWFLPSLALTENPAVDIGNALYDVPTVLLFALIMAYPSGHLNSRFDRVSVAILVVAATALNVLQLVPEPLIVNEGSNGLLIGLGLSLLTAVAILRRWYVALPGSREELLPVLIAGAVFVAGLMINLVRRIFEVSDTLGDLLQAANELAPAAIPIALLIGFYRRSELRLQALVDAIPDQILRVARDGPAIDIRMPSVVGTAAGRSDRARPATPAPSAAFASEKAMAATARALDEGGLQSFDYAIDQPEGRREFEVRLAASGPDEVTAIMRDFTEQRAADAEVRDSRARIVEATDAERRRLERDLHDGAQQRLVSLSLALRLIRQRLEEPDRSNEDTIAAVDMAGAELKLAIGELRELARGIHPAILTEAGLGAAIRSLAERSVVPAHVTELPDRRLAATIEATAYFVVSEALANTAKHASAEHVVIAAACTAKWLRIEVSDDGVGGADRSRGTGLEGLTDRVAALGGRLVVESQPGRGTHIVAEIPLE